MRLELARGIGEGFLTILPYMAIGVLFEAVIRTLKWHVKIHRAAGDGGLYHHVQAA